MTQLNTGIYALPFTRRVAAFAVCIAVAGPAHADSNDGVAACVGYEASRVGYQITQDENGFEATPCDSSVGFNASRPLMWLHMEPRGDVQATGAFDLLCSLPEDGHNPLQDPSIAVAGTVVPDFPSAEVADADGRKHQVRLVGNSVSDFEFPCHLSPVRPAVLDDVSRGTDLVEVFISVRAMGSIDPTQSAQTDSGGGGN